MQEHRCRSAGAERRKPAERVEGIAAPVGISKEYYGSRVSWTLQKDSGTTSRGMQKPMPVKTQILTDVAEGIWLDSYQLSAGGDCQLKGSSDWSITKKTLRGGVSAGIDVVEIDNGAFSITVLPTRGMGLWKGDYKGIPLGWRSPVKLPVHPGFVNLTEHNGLGWLSGFNELLCRCGLASHGAPGLDAVPDSNGSSVEMPLTLHGKIANTAAHHVEVAVSDEGAGSLSITGTVDEAMLFGSCFRLTSRLETRAGSNQLSIHDRVTNLSGQASEVELLYHTNFGRPFLEPNARFHAPYREMAPSDARSAEDVDTWNEYLEPTSGYAEQCYFLELLADEQDQTLVLLANAAADKGVSLRFSRRELPCFTLWKNTQAEADGYVTGLEPGTSLPNHRSFERGRGRVIRLEPGQSISTRLDLTVHDSPESLAEVGAEIAQIQKQTATRAHRQPHPEWSPES